MMLTSLTIKQLYALALAEGEGVGTAYEYFTKRLVLRPWLAQRPSPQRILVAGLPEKYGSSLDFLQIAAEYGAALTVCDERPEALKKLRKALGDARTQGWLTAVKPTLVAVRSLSGLEAITESYELALSSEVLQRLSDEARQDYFHQLHTLAGATALFAPNADNPSHTDISGLNGLHLGDLHAMLWRERTRQRPAADQPQSRLGYIDMPPFPPGITRSEVQREQATSGRAEALAMWGLAYYARAERWLPRALRQRKSHIVYALVG